MESSKAFFALTHIEKTLLRLAASVIHRQTWLSRSLTNKKTTISLARSQEKIILNKFIRLELFWSRSTWNKLSVCNSQVKIRLNRNWNKDKFKLILLELSGQGDNVWRINLEWIYRLVTSQISWHSNRSIKSQRCAPLHFCWQDTELRTILENLLCFQFAITATTTNFF